MPSSDHPAAAGRPGSVLPRLALFLGPPVLLWAVLEWGMARVPDSHTLKHERLEALAGEVDTLILGASESYYGIVPRQLDGIAFNLANTSQSLYYDDQLVTRLLPRLPRLRRVVLPISYFTLYLQTYDHPESWRQYQFYQGWGIPPAPWADRFDVRMWSRVALYSPRVALEQLRRRFRGTLAPEVDDRGWYRVPEETSYELSPAGASEVLSRHHGYMHDVYLSGNAATLEHMVALLRGRGVDVVLLTMPVWPTYQVGMRPTYRDRTRAVVDRLVREYGVRYLSFLHEPRLTAEDFMDCDHLSARGAAHFTGLLQEALGPLQPGSAPGTAARGPDSATPSPDPPQRAPE
jgi:hypothetical protein